MPAPAPAASAEKAVEAVADASKPLESGPASEPEAALNGVPAPALTAPAVEAIPAAAKPLESAPVSERAPEVNKAAAPAHTEKRVDAAAAAPKPAEPLSPAEPAGVSKPSEPEPLDPLLALAEQIRAAQAQRANSVAPVPEPQVRAAVPEPATAKGLSQLAAAVGIAETPAEPAVEAVPVAPVPAEAVQPVQPAAAAETKTQAVALLAPPEAAPVDLVQSAPAPEPQVTHVPQIKPQVKPQTKPPTKPPTESDNKPDTQNTAPAEAPVEQAPIEAKRDTPAVEPLTPPVMKDMVVAPAEAPVADKPPSGSWLQLAPLQNYASAATKAIHPVAPPAQILSPDSGPRITLPGPALPPKLERLHEAAPVTVIGEEPKRAAKRSMPGWLISLMLMLGIPLAGAVVLIYFQPIGRSSADAKGAQEASTAAADPSPSHPLSQSIEVTGFRILVDYNKKSEIHYLVVNHSTADLSDMTIYVTLRTANAKAGQPPLSRFSFRAPGLGPFESKEMTSPIEKLSRSVTLPDWQDLRAEVQIGQ
jgi:hypothetical protein